MKISGRAVIGTLVLGFGIFGVYNAAMSFGRPEVEKRDVKTTGVITRIHGTEISHRLTNAVLNRTNSVRYLVVTVPGLQPGLRLFRHQNVTV